MEKQWEKIAEAKYNFSIDNNLIGTLTKYPNTLESKATAQIGINTFHICRTGFWKNTIDLLRKSYK